MNLKFEKGITLIALVITIIILLILSGITISQLTGSGLFGKAKIAKQKARYGAAREIVDFKLMEIQIHCVENNEVYDINKIAKEMEDAEDITIEEFYTKETGKIKDGIKNETIQLEGIVVSVDEYSEYKFLIGESCKIERVITSNDGEESKEPDAKEEDKEVPALSDSIDISNPIEITTYMNIKTNTRNTLILNGIENVKYELSETTNNLSLSNNILTANNKADSKDSCKIKITGIYKGQSYTNNLIVYVEPKNITTVTDENGSEHDAYAIYTSDDLLRFAELINHKVQSIENVAIMNEIDLYGVQWTIIGNPDPTGQEGVNYSGIFDGRGNTIKNLTYTSDVCNGNLIWQMDNGILKNLNIDNINIEIKENNAGLIGQALNGSIIENVKILSGTFKAKGYAGAFGSLYSEGEEDANIIRNCYNNANISVTDGYAGGICSFQYGSIIENCENHGVIKGGSKGSRMGGICGMINQYPGSIINCKNYGDVSGNKYIGGICGVISGNTSSIIENCINNGTITGTSYTGNICGSPKK